MILCSVMQTAKKKQSLHYLNHQRCRNRDPSACLDYLCDEVREMWKPFRVSRTSLEEVTQLEPAGETQVNKRQRTYHGGFLQCEKA
jgi:hypothetical protein